MGPILHTFTRVRMMFPIEIARNVYHDPRRIVVPSDAEIAALRGWIESEFNQIPANVYYVHKEITLPECQTVLRITGDLYISSLENASPIMNESLNLKFRAMHDWHHISQGFDSTYEGEFAAFQYACQSAPFAIHWLLFSEIVCQAATAVLDGFTDHEQRVVWPWRLQSQAKFRPLANV